MKPNEQELAFLKSEITKVESQLSALKAKAALIAEGQATQSQVNSKSPQTRALEIQLQSQENHLATLKSQYEPMQAVVKSLQSQTQMSSAAVASAASLTAKQASDLTTMKSLFAKMVEIANKSVETAGAKITEAMVVSDALPDDHIVHTKVIEEALKQGDKAAFDLALSKLPDEDINYRDSKGKTLLMYQAANGFFYGVEALLKRGADADMFDKEGFNALYYAAKCPNTKVLKALASVTKNINHRYIEDQNDTVLGIMIRSNTYYIEKTDVEEASGIVWLCGRGKNIITGDANLELSIVTNPRGDGFTSFEHKIFKLIEHFQACGADINITSNQGLNIFTLACSHRFKYLANQLIDHFPIDLDATDLLGRGPLVYAMIFQDVLLLEKLRIKGADPKNIDCEARSCLHWMATQGFGLDWNDNIADWFLAHGADINARTIMEQTALSFAAQYNLPEVVKYLLAHSANPDIPQNQGAYPWHLAAYLGSLDALKVLRPIMTDIDVQATNEAHATALWYAASQGKVESVKYLESHGADPNCATADTGRTALQAAVVKLDVSTVEFLCKNPRVEKNKPDKSGASALYYSLGYAGTHNIAITKLLLQNGADPNQPMDDGDTPMHMAAYRANVKAMYFLLKHGAEINVLNNAKKSPLFVLIEKDDLVADDKTQAIKYLLLKGAKFDIQDSEGHILASVLDEHFPSAKDLISHPEQLPDLQEFEQTVIGEV